MSDTQKPDIDEASEVQRRVGRAWREIRRGASATRIRDLFYGEDGDDDALDMALADALTILCLEGPVRMGELAEALHITPASTTRAVTCLVDKGYAERVKAPDDQRSIMVSATEAGRARYQIISDRINDGLTHILSHFSSPEKVEFARLIERFVEAVDDFVESKDTNQ